MIQTVPSPIAAQVQHLLAQDPSLTYGLSEVAWRLGMSARTLSRILRQEGVTFRQLGDDVRRQVAENMLLITSRADTRAIAEALHYSDETSFVRAFRRWTGKTPRQWASAAKENRELQAAMEQTMSACQRK